MKKFIAIIKKIPLIAGVISVMLLLTLIGLLGKLGGYKNLNYNVLKKPAVSLVFQGLHDGVFPWSKVEEETEDSVESGVDTGDENWDTDYVAQTGSEANEEPIAASDENDTEIYDISSGYSYLTISDEAAKKDKSKSAILKSREKKSKNTFVYADEIPEGVNSEIVDAKDYGVMDMSYLDPEGTKYKPKDKTIFKKNMEFYLQTKAEDDSYFDDALFIGDSRTDGLANYGKLSEHASFFATESLTVYDIMEVSLPLRTPGGEEPAADLSTVLKNHKYKKLYFCIGINELGNVGTLKFYEKYVEVVQNLRKLAPHAVIFVQGIMHENKALSSKDPVFNNKNILEKNRAIATLANGHDIFYLDMNESVCDKNGNLKDDYTNDGIHLKAAEYVRWEDWLKDHVIYPAY